MEYCRHEKFNRGCTINELSNNMKETPRNQSKHCLKCGGTMHLIRHVRSAFVSHSKSIKAIEPVGKCQINRHNGPTTLSVMIQEATKTLAWTTSQYNLPVPFHRLPIEVLFWDLVRLYTTFRPLENIKQITFELHVIKFITIDLISWLSSYSEMLRVTS